MPSNQTSMLSMNVRINRNISQFPIKPFLYSLCLYSYTKTGSAQEFQIWDKIKENNFDLSGKTPINRKLIKLKESELSSHSMINLWKTLWDYRLPEIIFQYFFFFFCDNSSWEQTSGLNINRKSFAIKLWVEESGLSFIGLKVRLSYLCWNASEKSDLFGCVSIAEDWMGNRDSPFGRDSNYVLH